MRADHADWRNLQPGIRATDPDDGRADRKRSVRAMRAYTEYECSGTRNTDITSAAVHMIRVQAEQIRRMSAEEYLKEKTGSGADGQKHTE